MNWLFRRRPRNLMAFGKRLYEWRNANGAVLRSGLAEDACAFTLEAFKAGSATRTPAGEQPKNPIYVHVATTGERVITEESADLTASRIWNSPETRWRNVEGKEVKAP